MKACNRITGLLLALSLLTACSFQADDAPTQPESAESSRPTENVVNEYPVSGSLVLIESRQEGCAPRFDLYDAEADRALTLPTMPQFMELQEIVDENQFIFRATGQDSESAGRSFPYLFQCFRTGSDVDGEAFTGVIEPICFDLSEQVQAGSAKPCALADIAFSFDGVSLLFTPAGQDAEGAFYADYMDIPLTTVSYDGAANRLDVRMDGCIPADGLALPDGTELAYNPYITGCTLDEDTDSVTLRLSLGSTAAGYYAEKGTAGYPFLTVRLSGDA